MRDVLAKIPERTNKDMASATNQLQIDRLRNHLIDPLKPGDALPQPTFTQDLTRYLEVLSMKEDMKLRNWLQTYRFKMGTIMWEYNPKFMLKRANLQNHSIARETDFIKVYIELRKDRSCLLMLREMYNIYEAIIRTRILDGSIAEVGVYKGGSAKLISEFKQDKTLYLFDTFEGMPETDNRIDLHSKGDFDDCNLQKVRDYLTKYKDIEFVKGKFPESVKNVRIHDLRFSFVHLDVDIYESTLSGLQFFYPKMSKNGIIISHDYNALSCPGVKKAFDQFFDDKPENVIPTLESQCIVYKQ